MFEPEIVCLVPPACHSLTRSSGLSVRTCGLSVNCCAGCIIFVSLQAYAAARMAESVLLGLDGSDDIYECAYVESSVTKLPFFASKVCLGMCCIAP